MSEIFSIEDLKHMELGGIREYVMPPRENISLKGFKADIDSVINHEIIIVNWLFIGKSKINDERNVVKIQFVMDEKMFVTCTSAAYILDALKEYEEKKQGKPPFKTMLVRDGRKIIFKY